MSTALRAELQRRGPEIAWLFEFVVGGVTYRFSDASRPRVTNPGGLYQGRVVSWGGSIRRSVDPYEPQLALQQGPSPVIDDTSGALRSLLYGPLKHKVRKAPAIVTLASPNVDPGDWYAWTYLIEAVPQPSQLLWAFQLGLDALALKRDAAVPKGVINASDWPSSSVEVRGLPLPILYGRVSSANVANNGAIPCYLVDAAGFRYLVCAGRALSVDTVYKDGTPVAAANYAITYPEVNGRTVTLIDFTATQGSSSITCDATGYDSVGDGTGSLIDDPAAGIAHLFTNFVYGDWKSGAWLSATDTPFDDTSWAATFFSDRGYKLSAYVGGAKRRGLDLMNDLLKSFEARACWTPSGKTALKVEDYTACGEPAYVLKERETADWKQSRPTAQIADKLEGDWSQTPTGGYTQRLVVQELGTDEKAPDSTQLPFSPAFLL
jgi:hypothetical protein